MLKNNLNNDQDVINEELNIKINKPTNDEIKRYFLLTDQYQKTNNKELRIEIFSLQEDIISELKLLELDGEITMDDFHYLKDKVTERI